MKVIFRNKLFLRLALINFLFGAALSLYAVRTVFLAAKGLSSTAIGVVTAISYGLSTLSPLIGGFIADRFNSRHKVYFVALLGFALVVALLPLSGKAQIAGVALVAILMPLAMVFSPTGSTLVATCSINATMRPDAQGLQYPALRAFMSAGYSIASFAFTPAMRRWGEDAPMYILLFVFAGLLLLHGTIRETQEAPGAVQAGQKRGARRLNVRGIVGNYYIMTYLLSNVFMVMANNCFSFLTYRLLDIGIGTEMVTTVTGFKVLMEVVLMLLIPYAGKRISLCGLQIVACAFYVCELAIMPYASGILTVTLAELFGGAANGITCATAGMYVRKMAPEGLEATAQGLWSVTTGLSGVIFSAIFGALNETSGAVVTYRVGAYLQAGSLLLFIGTLLFGKYVLKKKNTVPIFLNTKSTLR